MLDRLESMGLKKRYKPFMIPEDPQVHLTTKRPPLIKNGLLTGTEITTYDDSTFLVWTNRTKLARAIAKEHNLKIRELTGEAEVWAPATLADDLLPRFGAKIKRKASEKQLEVIKKARLSSPLFKKALSEPPPNTTPTV